MIGFFFSSRRRHTRFDCDWSSDVCSSDLAHPEPHHVRDRRVAEREPQHDEREHRAELGALGKRAEDQTAGDGREGCLEEIGRASCGKECSSAGWLIDVKNNGGRLWYVGIS